ncbi:hypothetical protein RFI_22305 [Reticulomyxa filosa]|uniref:Uncharacterized protein n=1 Tax=Reticulomyxa filosa TaxID=46433 RepID=X6MMI0_RETFI|nr:hypothetical protein RFI_22305 [Reticulomyxa filosa]|eukprot:ETO15059.1 hypothetical protein RFI_22305 [Reticulomyxa filosa]
MGNNTGSGPTNTGSGPTNTGSNSINTGNAPTNSDGVTTTTANNTTHNNQTGSTSSVNGGSELGKSKVAEKEKDKGSLETLREEEEQDLGFAISQKMTVHDFTFLKVVCIQRGSFFFLKKKGSSHIYVFVLWYVHKKNSCA